MNEAYITPADELAPFEFNLDDFDIDAAFQGALQDTISDAELALDERIRRMETIVTSAQSEVYRDFVNFQAMAAQMIQACAHDHNLASRFDMAEIFGRPETDEHNHDHDIDDEDDDDDEIDPKTGKKKKKRYFS